MTIEVYLDQSEDGMFYSRININNLTKDQLSNIIINLFEKYHTQGLITSPPKISQDGDIYNISYPFAVPLQSVEDECLIIFLDELGVSANELFYLRLIGDENEEVAITSDSFVNGGLPIKRQFSMCEGKDLDFILLPNSSSPIYSQQGITEHDQELKNGSDEDKIIGVGKSPPSENISKCVMS